MGHNLAGSGPYSTFLRALVLKVITTLGLGGGVGLTGVPEAGSDRGSH